MVTSPAVRLLVFCLLLRATQSRECTSGEICTTDCPQLKEDIQKLGTLPRKSSEFKKIKASLDAQSCSEDEDKVCCTDGNTIEDTEDSNSTDITTSTRSKCRSQPVTRSSCRGGLCMGLWPETG